MAAAALFGTGLGGFLDGIILHQILQWQRMISARLPADILEAAKTSMFRDGMFHAGIWTLTAVGVVFLRRLAGRRDVLLSNGLLVGGLNSGWGQRHGQRLQPLPLQSPQVREEVANPQRWNHGFLALGLLQTAVGWIVVKRARRSAAAAR